MKLYNPSNIFSLSLAIGLIESRDEYSSTQTEEYPRIFSPQMEAIVFIILQISFATRAVLEIGEY